LKRNSSFMPALYAGRLGRASIADYSGLPFFHTTF
jgi:hypothetical protein